MIKVGNWVQRSKDPLPVNETFDWYPWSIAQVVQLDDDGIHVLFACKCMTYDESGLKFWLHGEYEPLNKSSLHDKLEQHDIHCPYKETTYEIKAWTETLQELSGC